MASAPRTDHTHVLLLRGINVGGHARVPMAHLREIAAAAGALEAGTHLNSGNVLFRVDGAPGDAADAEARRVAAAVESALEDELGLAVPVIPVSRAELDTALALHAQLPFAGGEDKLTHLAVLAEPADPEDGDALEALDAGDDRCAVAGRFVWMRFARASHTSRLTLDRIERILGTPATARNLLTVRHLAGVG
ncbi:DUF1697 domain-containing protein [Citricoccus sp. SGAir0253]|uniref:DUF1697 domain-containing protein n=1 Tax=Citricoccus sp. SGAir0253 TaxID=2567881 RepID=UPI0010CCCEDB|nr:DUF1697 domain-containing protein [Citricoccus sp. SGAir0253]QCU79201.1 DUF1697 domain-containing protein [Citricoccus sp. SGAir0253]